MKPHRKLIIRLSSLGDVILATAALDQPCDWIVKKEFAEILQGHPQIKNLFIYDRKTGIWGWFTFLKKVFLNDYDQVIDLQNSPRTWLARGFLLLFLNPLKSPDRPTPHWKVARKQRVRLYGYFIFKQFWPKSLRPHSKVKIFSYLSRGDSNGVSDFSHLLKAPIRPGLIPGKKYVCLMPSSRWQNKEWPVSNYVQWIQKSSLFPVVLGTPNDVASQALVKALESLKIEHQNEIGRSSFSDLAHLLKGATGFVGSDTGLFHFAESFGTRCAVFFGPTMPDQGFGPQKPATTVVIQKDLGCRPCGKDGRFCYRVFDRAACLRSISPKEFFSNNGFGEQKSDTP